MNRAVALVVGAVVLTATAGFSTTVPANADPALAITPTIQATDGSTPVEFDIVTSPGATTRCELYRKGTVIDQWSPCTGTVVLDVHTFAEGKYSLRAISSIPGSWRSVWADIIVDGTAPNVALTIPGGAFALDDSTTATWELKNVEPVSGTTFARQIRRGTPTASVADWEDLSTTTDHRMGLNLARGATACLRVQGTDAAANTGDWSNVECVTRPLDERQLDGWQAQSSGWKQIRESNFINKTGLVATAPGSQLTFDHALVGSLVIWGRKGPYSGKLEVRVDGRVIDTVSLNAKVAHRDVIFRKDFASPQRGRVALTVVTAARPVTLDAVAISSR